MPFAGRMKLNTFLLLVGGVGILGVAGLIALNSKLSSESGSAMPETDSVADEKSNVPEMTTDGNGHRNDVLAYQGKSLPTGKMKDMQPGSPYKINLYQDSGNASVNRGKVDLDRDEKWDEKWAFEVDGRITVQVSSADDENYDSEVSWAAGVWSDSGGAATSPTAPPVEVAVRGEGAADQAAFSWQSKSIPSKKQKDVTKGKPYKINVYQDQGNSVVNRLKIDLDRDDKWDEKWTFEGGSVSRTKSTEDNEDYDLTQEWSGDAWK